MAIEIHPAASSSVYSSHPESLPSDANPNIHHCPPSSRIKLKDGGADAQQSQLSCSILGLFLFYIGHDALQERMFRLDGFQYGFFMTLIEVVVMLLASMIVNEESTPSSSSSRKGKKKYTTTGKILTSTSTTTTITTKPPLSTATIIRIAWVGLLLALAHGLGNTSLNYSPYPLKVAFKSCKLVPTMAVGACLTYDRRYTALQYTAALVMGLGLAILSSADTTSTSVIHSNEEGSSSRILVTDEDAASSHDNNNNNLIVSSTWHETIIPYLGPLLLTISTGLDSAVPNIQEQLLRSKRVQTTDMIRISNGVMCACLAVYTYFSGEFHSAWIYCSNRMDASFMLLLQGICAYFGLRCYLSIIREYGGVMGVLLANARKVITIVLSFVLFSKPFNERHVVGLILVGIGVYLGCISKSTKEKKGGKKEIDMDNNMDAMVGERNDLILSTGGEEYNNRHEHSVREAVNVRTC